MADALTLRLKSRGAALAETVVITPLLLFIVILTAEVTNAYVDHNTLTKSARNGARYLASNAMLGTTGTVQLDADLINTTRNLVVFGNISGTGTSILPGLGVANVQVLDAGNNNVQISVNYPYTGLLGGTLPNFGFGANTDLGMTLEATVLMRAL